MQSPLYKRIVSFVAETAGVPPEEITPETTLFGDLNMDGDDGVELLEDFAREFDVDMSNCDPSLHFGPEGCLPWAPLYWIVLAFRKGTDEERARLTPIRISDLVKSAESGRWQLGDGGAT